MRTETISIYGFDELSDSAKQTAIENWRNSRYEYDWSGEWSDSINAFAEAMNITIRDWEVNPYGYSNVSWDLQIPWEWNYADGNPDEDMRGLRLRTWLINNALPELAKGKYYSKDISHNPYRYVHRYSKIQFEYNNCPLTGYCGDCPLIDPILEFIESGWRNESTTLLDVFQDCFDRWIKEFISDMEWQDSDEYITDTIEANEYEFYADGSLA